MDDIPVMQSESKAIGCRSCGARMKYNPGTGLLHCDYCDSDEKVEAESGELRKYELDEMEELLSQEYVAQVSVIKCKSCGAQITLDEDKTAEFCVFCGSPAIERVDSAGGFVPEYIIPFRVTDEDAALAFKNWLKKRAFAPVKLRSGAHVQKLKGVYVPHFAFDCDTFTDYEASIRRTKHNTSYYSGSIAYHCSNVVVPASSHINCRFEGNLGFMLDGLFKYRPEFVSGFISEKVSVCASAGFKYAQATGIDDLIRDAIKNEVGEQHHWSGHVGILSKKSTYDDVEVSAMLLPVWMSVYNYGKKRYEFIINGQSGRVKGKAPVSALKILLYLAVTGFMVYLASLLTLMLTGIVALIMLVFLWIRLSGNSN